MLSNDFLYGTAPENLGPCQLPLLLILGCTDRGNGLWSSAWPAYSIALGNHGTASCSLCFTSFLVSCASLDLTIHETEPLSSLSQTPGCSFLALSYSLCPLSPPRFRSLLTKLEVWELRDTDEKQGMHPSTLRQES